MSFVNSNFPTHVSDCVSLYHECWQGCHLNPSSRVNQQSKVIAGKIQFLKTPVQLTCSTGGQFSTCLAFMRLELRERFALNLEEIHQ